MNGLLYQLLGSSTDGLKCVLLKYCQEITSDEVKRPSFP